MKPQGILARTSGTSTFKHHLRTSHPQEWKTIVQERDADKQSQITQFLKPKPIRISDHERAIIDEKLALLIVGSKIAFNVLRRPEFKDFVASLNPAYPTPSVPRLHETLDIVSAKLDADLSNTLAKALAVSFTMDGWTAFRKHFLAITVHYITVNGTINEALLPLQFVDERHTAQTYATKFKNTLQQFLVDGDVPQIGGVTTDNASNMLLFAEHTEIAHATCIAHTLNLFLRGVLDTNENVIVIQRLRELVVAFRRSDRYARALHESQAPTCKLNLILDVETRWNSTFLMISRAVELKGAVQKALIFLDSNENLSGIEWERLTDLCEVLQIYHETTVALSASSTVTISKVVPYLKIMRRALENTKMNDARPLSTVVKRLKSELLRTFDERFGTYLEPDSIQSIATFLHSKYRPFVADYIPDIISAIKTICETDELPTISEPLLLTPSPPLTVPKRPRLLDHLLSTAPELKTKSVVPKVLSLTQQIDGYLAHPLDEDPLKYWVSQRINYPQLASFALRILSIQATEVPCERSFSSAGQFFCDSRSSMSPTTIIKLMTIFANHPKLKRPVDEDPQ